MKVIKFRAWDTKWNRMMEQESDDIRFFHPTKESRWMPYHPDLILMQYTGLKDKNGKEIYEGDVVKNSGYHELCIVEYHHSQYIGRYRPQTPQYKHLEQNERDKDLYYIGIGFYVCERKSIEVIGNIYENADLLAEVSP